MRKILNNKGETIIEAMVAFLIAAISTVMLLTAGLAATKLFDAGDSKTNSIRKEEMDVEDFIISKLEANGRDTMRLVDGNKVFGEIQIGKYESGIYKFIGFREDKN